MTNLVEMVNRVHAVLEREGRAIADVVADAGYYDQAHLTRSLRQLIGLTPSLIARGGHQLSFLYKTEAGARPDNSSDGGQGAT